MSIVVKEIAFFDNYVFTVDLGSQSINNFITFSFFNFPDFIIKRRSRKKFFV